MSSLFTALRFIGKCIYPVNKNVESYKIKLPLAKRIIDCIVYKTNKNPATQGTMLSIHGMTSRGNLDPRMENVCRALANIGYIVVSPLYTEIQQLWIKDETVENIADTISAITADKSLSPYGNLSIFSASFSAGMAVIAATYPRTRNLVNAVCAIGTYSDVDSSIRYLLASEDNDEYGTFIILRNILPYSMGSVEGLSEALHTAILDNGYARQQPELPEFLRRLPVDTRQLFKRLRTDAAFRLRQWEIARANSDYLRCMINKLSVVRQIQSLKAAVALVHGSNDNVVPVTESMKLFRHLRQYSIPARLCITNAISHGDVKINADIITTVYKLLLTFSFFFRKAENRSSLKK